jgi:hypothetical protein
MNYCLNLDLIPDEFRINDSGIYSDQLRSKMVNMVNPEQVPKVNQHSDIALGFATALTICCATVTALLSYSFNSRIIPSILIGLVVVLQGFLTWSLSGRK